MFHEPALLKSSIDINLQLELYLMFIKVKPAAKMHKVWIQNKKYFISKLDIELRDLWTLAKQ